MIRESSLMALMPIIPFSARFVWRGNQPAKSSVQTALVISKAFGDYQFLKVTSR